MSSRAALVTGAASGIGRAIAERLRHDGLDVLGRLDVIVPNAGVQHVAPVKEFPEDRWDALLALMLTSPFLLDLGWSAR